jgi:hypothetical protein
MTRFAASPPLQALRQLYRALLLPCFALALLAIMWAAVIYQVGQEKANARFEAVLHSQSLARTLAEHTNHLLRQTDHATQLFKLKFEETNGALRLAEFAAAVQAGPAAGPGECEWPGHRQPQWLFPAGPERAAHL